MLLQVLLTLRGSNEKRSLTCVQEVKQSLHLQPKTTSAAAEAELKFHLHFKGQVVFYQKVHPSPSVRWQRTSKYRLLFWHWRLHLLCMRRKHKEQGEAHIQYSSVSWQPPYSLLMLLQILVIQLSSWFLIVVTWRWITFDSRWSYELMISRRSNH